VTGFALELRKVVKRWRGSVALNGVDLQVAPGSVVGLVGPSGAGKTTAMRVGLGLLAPEAGEARVFEAPARVVARERGRVGLLLDGPALESALSVADNLRLHALRHGRPPVDPAPWLERLELTGIARRRAGRLSQGEQFRVALVRALLLDPDLLVLDEPAAHLDPALAQTALDLLREAAARGAAILVSSHQLTELERVATHLILLHKGEVLLSGPLERLLATVAPALRIDARPGDRAAALLATHPAIARLDEVRVDGVDLLRAELRAGATDPTLAAGSLNAELHAAGISVHRLAPERPTLEELFRRTLLRTSKTETAKAAP